MGYVNTGALVDGKRPASKAALKRALADAPDTVVFDSTSMFDGGVQYTPESLPVGVSLSVVGPDPYTTRNYYATVVRGRDGRVKLT